jgi:uncharacterized protein (DUF1800 family)
VVRATATYTQRLATARLLHRFNFGPTPGQYTEFLQRGLEATQTAVLEHGPVDPGLDSVGELTLPDLGPYPVSGTPAWTAFWNSIYGGSNDMDTWWLDRMTLATYPLNERMTWFWHGHFATAISKVVYPLPMLVQNESQRSLALGNFRDLAREMVLDGALNFWLDNEMNYSYSPNENLAREFMELFTLGVGTFSQHDVTAAALALTGYDTVQWTGEVTFDAKGHYSDPLHILGTTARRDAPSFAALAVSQHENARFITDRMWYRFVSSTTTPPPDLMASFKDRNIAELVTALVRSKAWTNPANSLVKSPVEWFVGACRALRVRPSTLNVTNLLWDLSQMGQVPFDPPNVGGWPAGQAWLSGAALQYKFETAQMIVAAGDLSPLSVPASQKMQVLADWLGIPEWSRRTSTSLLAAGSDSSELMVAALCAPEFLVSA